MGFRKRGDEYLLRGERRERERKREFHIERPCSLEERALVLEP